MQLSKIKPEKNFRNVYEISSFLPHRNFIPSHPLLLVVARDETSMLCFFAPRRISRLLATRDKFCPWKRAAKFGGPERDRTAGLMLAKHALSQLSYRPWNFLYFTKQKFHPESPAITHSDEGKIPFAPRPETLTPKMLAARDSGQFSLNVIFGENWWAQKDSNLLPPRYQHDALPIELWAQITEPTGKSVRGDSAWNYKKPK